MMIDVIRVSFDTRHNFTSIINEANLWQKARGSEGWNRTFDDEWMLPHIRRQELYIAYIDGEAVAVFRLLWRDEAFWGDREAGDSIYLHTFATKRKHSGRGIGNAVIQWVANFGREHKRKQLRLDCFHSNKNLISFYERNGFTSVGFIIKDGRALTLMEQPI